jgi:hypothetical protein
MKQGRSEKEKWEKWENVSKVMFLSRITVFGGGGLSSHPKVAVSLI